MSLNVRDTTSASDQCEVMDVLTQGDLDLTLGG